MRNPSPLINVPNKSRLTMTLQRKLFAPSKTVNPYRVHAGLDEIWIDKYTRDAKPLDLLPTNTTSTESTKVARPKPYVGPFKVNIAAGNLYRNVSRASNGLFDDLLLSYNKEYEAKSDSINKNSIINKNGNLIIKPKDLQLTSGRYNLAKVNPGMISDLVSAAKRQGVNPNLMVALAGRESTFDTSRRAVKGGGLAGHRSRLPTPNIGQFMQNNEMQDAVSGWTVQDPYLPIPPEAFLADRKAPGIVTFKTARGVTSYVNNEEAINKYLKDNPKVMDQYRVSMKRTKDVKNLNTFDMAARRLADKGLTSYNPGDKQYTNKLREDHALLAKDPVMNNYLKSLGVDPNKKFKRGGLLY